MKQSHYQTASGKYTPTEPRQPDSVATREGCKAVHFAKNSAPISPSIQMPAAVLRRRVSMDEWQWPQECFMLFHLCCFSQRSSTLPLQYGGCPRIEKTSPPSLLHISGNKIASLSLYFWKLRGERRNFSCSSSVTFDSAEKDLVVCRSKRSQTNLRNCSSMSEFLI